MYLNCDLIVFIEWVVRLQNKAILIQSPLTSCSKSSQKFDGSKECFFTFYFVLKCIA